MKKVILAILFAPLTALVGSLLGGLIPGNVLALVARSGLERGSMSEQTAYILSPCGTFAAIGLVAGLSFAFPVRKFVAGQNARFVFLAVGLILAFVVTIGMPPELRAVTTVSFGLGAIMNTIRYGLHNKPSHHTVDSRADASANGW